MPEPLGPAMIVSLGEKVVVRSCSPLNPIMVSDVNRIVFIMCRVLMSVYFVAWLCSPELATLVHCWRVRPHGLAVIK